MKNEKLLLRLLIITLFSGLLISCDDDDGSEEDLPQAAMYNTLTLDAQERTLWHYFNFEDGNIVGTGSADPQDGDDATWKQRTDWDLAFHRNDVRTNSGVSGIGQGGMLEATETDFEEVLVAPASGYTVDDSIQIALTPAMPPVYTGSTGNSVCDDWASYDHDEHAWIFAEKVFIVKTADGKYAKIWLKSFLDDEDNSGRITMEYAYQSDGSTSLE
ncbi:hypothetical protein GM418_29205 [Maribellus comscasis]|uniref:Heme-binding protein HmuY n=1 Tax=Maribellus comscasis TaxID=2681766 RepID=A0A6I6K2H6_9BACT|nr:HmuY family protein [Maribellus comscasis]QGY47600.1 hypothetical protein GM418_29205 [Maribellus comscasis]